MKKIIPILLFLNLFFCNNLIAQLVQNSTEINTAEITTYAPILKKSSFFFDFTQQVSPLNYPDLNFDSATKYLKIAKSRLNLAKCYSYFKFSVFNEKIIADTLVFYPGSIIKHIELFELDSITQKAHSIIIDKNNQDFIPLYFKANTNTTIVAKLKFANSGFTELYPNLIRKKNVLFFQNDLYNQKGKINTFGYVLSGVLLMMILFTLTNYILSKKKEFLYYFLYSLTVFFIVFFNAALYKQSSFFSVLFWEYLDFFLLLLGAIFYIRFCRFFLITKIKYPFVDKVFKVQELFLAMMLFIFSFFHFCTTNIPLTVLIENIMKVVLLLFGIFYIVLAFTQKDRLLKYLAVGNGLSFLFWIISLTLILKKVLVYTIFSSALIYYEMGLVTALIAFLLGLTYKNREEIIETERREATLKLEATKQKYETEIAVYKAQQEERNRISADMHDDLGAGMTSIRLYSELAKNKLADKDLTELNKISSSADELLSKMNAIIWSMASSNDTLENMIAYLRSYAIEYFEDTSVNCTINLPQQIPQVIVNGSIRRNVFLVVKEALNNTLKHSAATETNLTLTIKGKEIKLIIQDNGKGIDFNNLRQFSNGLKNMKKRMDDVEIDFKIENSNGTLITLIKELKE